MRIFFFLNFLLLTVCWLLRPTPSYEWLCEWVSTCVYFIFPLDLWLPRGQGQDWLDYSNLVWMSRLVTPQAHKEGIKKCITYVIRLSLGSRADSGKGSKVVWGSWKENLPLTFTGVRLWGQKEWSHTRPRVCLAWISYQHQARECCGPSVWMRVKRREGRGGAWQLLVIRHQKWSRAFIVSSVYLLSKQTVKTSGNCVCEYNYQ